jgi:hypothetical protein
MAAKDLYRAFHGRNPRSIRNAEFRVPRELVFLGNAVDISYRCDKRNGGGDGKMATYIHDFARGTKLFTDENGKILIIIGEKLKIKESGINN